MLLFTGTFENKVDRKGRVSLPADFRAELAGGGDRVVYAYPSPVDDVLEVCDRSYMQTLAQRIAQQPMFSEAETDLNTTIVASARKLQIDETGRVTLPLDFLDFAGISDRAVFRGFGDRFQILAPARHGETTARARQRFQQERRTLPPAAGEGA